MKRILLILTGVILPFTAFAAAPDTALSPWVVKVLLRAQAGIQEAQTLGVSEACSGASGAAKLAQQQDAITYAQSILRQFADTRTQITRQSAALRERTLCEQSDLNRIEAKMQDVRTAMSQAIDACKLQSAQELVSVYSFLAQAYGTLAEGGLDPNYRTDLLKQQTYAFGTTINDTEADTPMCPFHSDYAVHSFAYGNGLNSSLQSYGCDVQTLATLPEAAEAKSQVFFLVKANQLMMAANRAIGDFIPTMDGILATLRGTTPNPAKKNPTLTLPVAHAKVSGCLALSEADIAADSAPSDANGNVPYGRVRPYLQDFSPPALPGTGWLPVGLLLAPAYDSFSLYSNPISLLRRAVEKGADYGARMAVPTATRENMQDMYQNADSIFNFVVNFATSNKNLQLIGADQGHENIVLNAWGEDSIDQTNDAFKPLNNAMYSLTSVTKDGGVLPNYVRDLAYFLLRSCTGSFCEKNLNNVLKRILNPYCHPYTSTLYTQDKVAEKCFCQDTSWPGYNDYCVGK